MKAPASPTAALEALAPEDRAELIRLARAQCWRDGNLRWKLDANQRGLYDALWACARKRFVLECARRLGKSFLLIVVAIEACLRRSGARVVYGAPTIKEVTEILAPIVDEVCADAPPECKPELNSQTGHVEFPNGSRIVLFGCDDKRKANRGRGPGADLVVIDEAGFIEILGYVLHSVVNPQTLTTGGKVLLASTPSDEPDHDFTRIAEQAEADGNYAHRVITDNPRLTPERIAEYVENEAKDLGMTVEEYRQSDVYQREHLARRVVDKTLVVMGEDWTKARETCVRAVERPKFFDAYTVLDMGGMDPHAALFGYWHFELGALVIEDELLLRDGCNTTDLAEAIKAKERALWGVTAFEGTLRGAAEAEKLPSWVRTREMHECPGQPFLRVCDNDAQMAIDLSTLHGLAFLPTAKHDKHVYVNHSRVLLRAGKVLVHPRCRHLDRHLRTTVWTNARRTDYRRKGGEHGDLVDCLVYLSRNVRQERNPAPAHWGKSQDQYWLPEPEPSAEESALLTAFGALTH